jgi:hypothetical protein
MGNRVGSILIRYFVWTGRWALFVGALGYAIAQICIFAANISAQPVWAISNLAAGTVIGAFFFGASIYVLRQQQCRYSENTSGGSPSWR